MVGTRADSRRFDLSVAKLVFAVVVLGMLGGGSATLLIRKPTTGLAVVLPVVAVLPIVVRLAQRRFDPFEPVQTLALTFLFLYGIRPAAELLSGFKFFDNQYTRSGFTGACLISLVGIASIYAGYVLPSGTKAARRAPHPADRWDPARSVRFGVWVLVVSALLTAAFAATVGPSTLFHFYLGRTTTTFQTFLAVSGYVGLGPYLTIPAAVIFAFAFVRLRSFKVFVLFVFSLAVAIFVSVPQGDRTYVLALVLPLIVFPYLRRDRRPSGALTLVVVLTAILGLNVLLATRTVGKRAPLLSETTSAIRHIPAQLKHFATGVDLAEFSVLELEYEAYTAKTNRLGFHPAQTLASLLAYPLPRHIVGTKPPAAGQFVVDRLFPNKSGARASFNPALFGDFYADYGWTTVVLYCFVIGIAVRFLWEYFLLHKASEGIQIVFAASLPILVIMVRNSVTDAIARALFLVGPLLLCLIVCSRPRMRRLAGYRVRPARGSVRSSSTVNAPGPN